MELSPQLHSCSFKTSSWHLGRQPGVLREGKKKLKSQTEAEVRYLFTCRDILAPCQPGGKHCFCSTETSVWGVPPEICRVRTQRGKMLGNKEEHAQKPQQESGSLPDLPVGCWQSGCVMLTGIQPTLCPVGRAGQTPAPARLDTRCSGCCTALPLPSPLFLRNTRNKRGCSSSPRSTLPPARALHSRVPFQQCQLCHGGVSSKRGGETARAPRPLPRTSSGSCLQ